MTAPATSALASFEHKWLAANPEQATVAIFLRDDVRARAAALGSLLHEIEQTAFGVREAHVAEAKLQWWRQELAAATAGRARHPITQALFADARVASLAASVWQALIDGALAMLAPISCADLAGLMQAHAPWFSAQARIEAALSDTPSESVAALADLATLSHLLLALRHLDAAQERFPLPLDLLARYQLARADLAVDAANRSALLRDLLEQLSRIAISALALAPLAPLGRRVRARLDLALMRAARRAPDPARALLARPGDARWRALGWSWREARRGLASSR